MQNDWLLGPGSVTWKMMRERALLLGGGRALILQVAHPLVGAGVQQHSAFQQDPWRRLRRTSDFYLSLVYARQQDLPSLNRWLEHAHRGVQGRSADGQPYDAQAPELMAWVQATLADSTMWAWSQLWGAPEAATLERFWQEQRQLGQAIGVDLQRLPDDWAGFQEWMGAHILRLQPTPAAQAVVAQLQELPVALPGVPLLAWRAGLTLGRGLSRQALAAGTPAGLREPLGLQWSAADQLSWERTCRRLRTLLHLLPRPLRHSGHARAALRAHRQD